MKDDDIIEMGPLDEAEPSPEELAAAERLRDALAAGADVSGDGGRDGDGPDGLAADEIRLARALGHAFDAKDLAAEAHDVILARALARRAGTPPARSRARGAWLRTAAATGALAVAAAVVFFLCVRSSSNPRADMATGAAPPVASVALVPRSTEPLFVGQARPLGRRGSARVDRIAAARSGEYLQARLVAWGAQ